MRNKITIFNLFLVLIFIGTFYNVYANNKKSLIQNVVEGTNIISEIPINEVAPKMYVTLIDSQKRIIATSNPNNVVDEIYATDGTIEPQKILSLTDDIYVLFEIPETINSNLEKGIKDGVLYYLNLPLQIVPKEEHIIGSDVGPSEPIDLISDSDLKAFGGIYSEDDVYKFKVKFENTLDNVDVKLNYQFGLNLNDRNLKEGINKVNLDFNLGGKLDLYVNIPKQVVPEEPVVPEEQKYNMEVSGIWNISKENTTNKADDKATWTIDITSTKEDDNVEGTLKVNLPGTCDHSSLSNGELPTNCIGIDFEQADEIPSLIKMYANGKELILRRNGELRLAAFLNASDNTPVAYIDFTNFIYGEDRPIAKDIANSFEIQLSPSSENVSLKGNVSVEFNSVTFNVDNTSSFKVEANLVDNADNSLIKKTGTINKEYQSFTITQGITSDSTDTCLVNDNCSDLISDESIPDQLIYQIKTNGLANAGNDYIELEIEPSIENTSGVHYVPLNFDARYTSAGEKVYEIEQFNNIFREIKIGNEKIDFEFFIKSGIDDHQFSDEDLKVALMMKQLENSDGLTKIFVSKKLYDGKRYILVLSPETYAHARKIASDGNYYAYVNSNEIGPLKWRVYLFNTLGKEVVIEYNHNRIGIDTDIDILKNGKEKSLINEAKVTSGNVEAKAKSTLTTTYDGIESTLEGKYITNSLIDWETKINLDKFFRDDFKEYLMKYNDDHFQEAYYLSTSKNMTSPSWREFDFCSPNCKFTIDDINYPTRMYNYTTKSWIRSKGANYGYYFDETETSFDKIEYNYIVRSFMFGSFFPEFIQYTSDDKERMYRYYASLVNEEYLESGKTYDKYIDYVKNEQEYSFSACANIMNNVYPLNDQLCSTFNTIRIRTTATIPKATLTKQLIKRTESPEDDDGTIRHDWKTHTDIKTTGTDNKNYYYNGHIDITDDMSNSEMYIYKEKDGSNEEYKEELKIDSVTPGKYTYLNNLTVKYKANGKDYSIVYSEEELKQNKVVKTNDGVTITFTYNGNMEKGFNVAFDDLVNGEDIYFEYTTTFDQIGLSEALINSGTEISSNLQVKLVNNANLPHTDIKATPVYDNINLTLYLSVDKDIEDYEKTLNYSKKYKITATTGYSSVSYLELDDSINRYEMIDKDSNVLVPWMDDEEYLHAIANSFRITDLVIYYKEAGQYYDEIIYSNGVFADEWDNSALDISDTNENGLLYEVRFENSTQNIPAGSTFEIQYIGTLNMDNKLSDGKSFRESEYYPEEGQRLYIDTLVNARVPNKKIPVTNNDASTVSEALVTYNVARSNISEVLEVQGGAAGTYLAIGDIYKILETQKGSLTSWTFSKNYGSVGKKALLSEKFTDVPSYEISNDIPDENKNIIIGLLKKYQTYQNIKLYYGKDEILTLDGVLENEKSVTFDNKKAKINLDSDGNVVLEYENFELGKSFSLKYDINIDTVEFSEEAQKLGVFNDKMELIGDEENPLSYKIGNTIKEIEEIEEEWGSEVVITGAEIKKKVIKNDDTNDSTTWQIDTTTESTDYDKITIRDIIAVISDNKDIIEKTLKVKDIKLTMSGKLVYDETSEEIYLNGFTENNIDIVKNGLSFDVIIKNTDTNKVLGSNQTIKLEYKTIIDKDIYTANNGSDKYSYSLENSASLIDDDNEIVDNDRATSIDYVIDIPISVTKSKISTSEDMTSIDWNIKADTNNVDRFNFKISDNHEVADEFIKYMFIDKMIIKTIKGEEEKIIYDSNASTNNIKLYKSNTQEKFKFNELSSIDFDIVLDKVEKDTIVEVLYTTSLNKEKYLEDNKETDLAIKIDNAVIVNSDDGATASSVNSGIVKVPTRFSKGGSLNGFSDINKLPLIKWNINVNLLNNYSKEDLTSANVMIEDKLSTGLKYYNGSLKVYKKKMTEYGNVREKELIVDEDYKFEMEDNVIRIIILKPEVNNNVEVIFETECLTSLKELDNYATLTINDEKEIVQAERFNNLLTTNLSGIVTSNKAVNYIIIGTKYLDNKESKIPFEFIAVEVDENGSKIASGYESIVTNYADGKIEFAPIKFTKEGVYYFQIKETSDNDKTKYKLDNSKYTIKIEVGMKDGSYIVINEELIDADSIQFNNRTIIDEVPDTYDGIGKYILIFVSTLITIIGIMVFNRVIYKYN